MRVLSPRVHALLDYGMVVLLLALPRLLSWSEAVTILTTVMGLGLLAYTLMTAHELAPLRFIPMGVHILLDQLSGAAFLVAALLLTGEPEGVRIALALIGLAEIGAATVTEPLSTSRIEIRGAGRRSRA